MITIDTIKEEVYRIAPHTKLLSDEYINNAQPLLFQCECGALFTKTWTTIQQKHTCKCRSCMRKEGWANKRREKDYKEKWEQEFIAHGFTLIEFPVRAKDKVLCHNKEGYKGKISLENVRLNKMFSIFSLSFNEENLLFNLNHFAELNYLSTRIIQYYPASRSCEIKIKCKCGCGKIFYTNVGNFTTQHKWVCDRCSNKMSSLEKRVENELIKYNIKYCMQHRFDDCRNPNSNYPLPFDFYLPQYNICIEVDGEQHYNPASFHNFSRIDDLQFRDKIKDEYCKNNNIHLLRLPYTLFKNDKYKEELNNLFVKYIMQ